MPGRCGLCLATSPHRPSLFGSGPLHLSRPLNEVNVLRELPGAQVGDVVLVGSVVAGVADEVGEEPVLAGGAGEHIVSAVVVDGGRGAVGDEQGGGGALAAQVGD